MICIIFSLGLNLQGIGGSKLGPSIGTPLDFLNSTKKIGNELRLEIGKCTFPKELGRCNEFVEFLEVFPHQHDIYFFV
jgi:hypothetical protein